jgi:hypothetical protein
MSAPSGVLGNGTLRTTCTAGSRTSEFARTRAHLCSRRLSHLSPAPLTLAPRRRAEYRRHWRGTRRRKTSIVLIARDRPGSRAKPKPKERWRYPEGLLLKHVRLLIERGYPLEDVAETIGSRPDDRRRVLEVGHRD